MLAWERNGAGTTSLALSELEILHGWSLRSLLAWVSPKISQVHQGRVISELALVFMWGVDGHTGLLDTGLEQYKLAVRG